MRLVEELRSGLGLILVTSPAYDGASTTCYSIMSFLAQGQRDVLSIESPIQWAMDGVRQVEAETGPHGPRMEETLRAMVAVRPDVLMLSACPTTPRRSLAAQLASSLLVIAQATAPTAARGLVAAAGPGRADAAARRLARPRPGPAPGPHDLPDLPQPAEPPAAQTLAAHGIDRDEAQTLAFFKGKGCPTCNTIGYRGRRAIFEALPASAEVRSALERGRSAEEVEAAAVESGMITMRERALGLVRSGVTTFDEFARLRL